MAQSVQVRAVNWRHERLADLMIANPQLTLGEIAKELNISQAWLSIVKNSDAFIDYWRLRSKAHSDAVTSGIKEKAAALTEMSLDVLLKDTEEKVDLGVMSAREARENLDLVTRRFGFDGKGGGTSPAAAPAITLNLGVVSADMLSSARSKLRSMVVPEIEVLPVAHSERSEGEK